MSKSDAVCGGSNGSATVIPNGQPPYTYLWSNGGRTQTIYGLPPGTYRVNVRDANQCVYTGSVTLFNQNDLEVFLDDQIHTTCGEDNGFLQVAVSGGTGPYDYQWSNNESGNNIDELAPGEYQVLVTDYLGCTATGSYSIQASENISIPNFNVNPATCDNENGSIELSATGGVTPYTYRWSNGASGAFIRNLAPGTYVVTITDAESCQIVQPFSVESEGSIDLEFSVKEPSCGADNGGVEVKPAGGNQPYTYQWNIGEKAIHNYELVVNVKPDFEDQKGDDFYTFCGFNNGIPQKGEGLFNQFEIDSNEDNEPDEVKTICEDLAFVTFQQSVNSIEFDGNEFLVVYKILVRNNRSMPVKYRVTELERFDDDVKIRAVGFDSSDPNNPGGDLSNEGPWDLTQGGTIIEPGGLHEYTLSMKGKIDFEDNVGDNQYDDCESQDLKRRGFLLEGELDEGIDDQINYKGQCLC